MSTTATDVAAVDTAVSVNSLPARQRVMAQARKENFPVVGLMLGRRYRQHLLSLYGFARLVDDTGDEAPGERLALLEELQRELDRIYAGAQVKHPIMRSLRPTVQACRLPEEPFRRLLEANRVDQVRSSYETFEQLLSYCQLSAAPVGELVLHVFDAANPARIALSDCVCAALQVIEHLQDVAEDHSRGRVYLPQEDLARLGCSVQDLSAPSASAALRAVIGTLAGRSRALLETGTPLLDELALRPRLAVAGFIAGGRSTLAALEHAEFDVLARRPRRSRGGFARALVEVLRWR